MDQFFKYEKPILKKVNLVQVLWSTKTALSPEDKNTPPLSTRPLAWPPMTMCVYLTSNKDELSHFYMQKSVT